MLKKHNKEVIQMKHQFILKHTRYYTVDVELTETEAQECLTDGKANDKLILKCYEDYDYDLFCEEFEDNLSCITDEVVEELPTRDESFHYAVINHY